MQLEDTSQSTVMPRSPCCLEVLFRAVSLPVTRDTLILTVSGSDIPPFSRHNVAPSFISARWSVRDSFSNMQTPTRMGEGRGYQGEEWKGKGGGG